MKKRIFIAIHYLEIGGAEMSLIGLLQSFDYNMVEVDLFVYRHQGELLAMIPKEVNLLPEIPAYTQIEAQILCKPVIGTNYTTAPSQIKDGIDGVIVPMDNTRCADGIVDFIKNKDLQSQIIDYLRNHHYGNEEEVKRFINYVIIYDSQNNSLLLVRGQSAP